MVKMKYISLHTNFKYLFSYLFNLYVVILIFDPMRESLDFGFLGTCISAFRDLLIFALVFMILQKKRKNHSIFLLLFTFNIISFLMISLFSEIGIFKNLMAIYGCIRGLLLCFVIINLNGFYKYSSNFLMCFYVKIVIFNFLTSLIIYFCFPQLLTEKYFLNRISVGNPSMQSIVFLTAFLISFYYKPFGRVKSFFISLLLLLATISTVTSTAFVGLFIILFFTFFNKKYFLEWVVYFICFSWLTFLILFKSGIDFNLLIGTVNYKLEELCQLFYKYLSGNSVIETQSKSFSIREMQILRFKRNVDAISLVFGDGIFSMADTEKYMIENTYWALIKDFGITGAAVYFVFLGINIFIGIKTFLKTGEAILLIAVLIIAAYSMTLYIFAGTSMIVQLFLFFWLIYNREMKEKK